MELKECEIDGIIQQLLSFPVAAKPVGDKIY